MKTVVKLIFFITLLIPILLFAVTLLKTDTGFIYPANMKHASSPFYGFQDRNPVFGNRCHLANDYKLPVATPIYATDKGVVMSANANIPGYNSAAGAAGAIIIKHQTSAGTDFYGLYGHINNLTVAVNDTVSAGQKIAEIAPYSFGSHLHFGINTVSANIFGYTPTTACTDNLGFVDPEPFLTSNHTTAASCKAVADSITTTKNTLITSSNVLANDTDADGDTLSVSGVDANSSNGIAIVDNSDGTFTYTPAIDFVGTDSFNYTLSDSNGCTSQGVVSVSITNPDGSGGGDNSGGGSGDGSGGSGSGDGGGGSSNSSNDSDSGGGSFNLSALVLFLLIPLIRRKRLVAENTK